MTAKYTFICDLVLELLFIRRERNESSIEEVVSS